MDIKLIALDMDGTLLNSRHELSPETIRALYKLKEKGIICVICTGRSIAGLEKYPEVLDLDMPVITFNGAVIIDSDKIKILNAFLLQKEYALKIWQLSEKYNTNLIIWSDNKPYCNRINEQTLFYSKVLKMPLVEIENVQDFIENHQITKMMFFDHENKIKDFKSNISKIKDFNVNYCMSNQYMLEFFNVQASKANALDFLRRYYNITPEQMMAFGDGENDIDMLDYVGFGIVMENALDSVKAHGKYITKSNDEDGVAFAIDKFIFSENI